MLIFIKNFENLRFHNIKLFIHYPLHMTRSVILPARLTPSHPCIMPATLTNQDILMICGTTQSMWSLLRLYHVRNVISLTELFP